MVKTFEGVVVSNTKKVKRGCTFYNAIITLDGGMAATINAKDVKKGDRVKITIERDEE